MKIIAWNSQGAKWDIAWTSFMSSLVKRPPEDDVVLVLTEAGWAPWMKSGNVTGYMDHICSGSQANFDAAGAAASTFCTAIETNRKYKATWVPWVSGKSLISNSRCSLGAAFFPRALVSMSTQSVDLDGFIRPTICLRYGQGINPSLRFTIYNVHMVSGSPAKAISQLNSVMKGIQALIPQSTPAIVVGDMNIDLLNTTRLDVLPPCWSIVNTGVATQQSGAELDYGLLYDPSSQLGSSTAKVVKQYKTGTNTSDHSVILYDIPL